MAKKFSNLAKDGSARVMQVASSIQTHDDTTVAQNSPLSYGIAVTINIDVPANAAELVLKPSTNIKISEDSTLATYFVLEAGNTTVIPVGRTENVYLIGETVAGTLQFYFHLV